MSLSGVDSLVTLTPSQVWDESCSTMHECIMMMMMMMMMMIRMHARKNRGI